MSKKWFTADWHAGEVAEKVAPVPMVATHSYLRKRPTDIMVLYWIIDCKINIQPEDTLYFLGDLALRIEDLDIFKLLPPCKKVLILGDKEFKSKFFTREQFDAKMDELQIFDEIHRTATVTIGDVEFFMAHIPSECSEQSLPSLCGHIHGTWRTQDGENGQPIINVGIDAWPGIVPEEHVIHQYGALANNHYDKECRVKLWK